jgi:ABC-type transport system involved in multi-copper enzyme maturation permease subunit
LKQTFSNSLLKSQYFLAKYLGGLLIIATPLTLIFLLTVLIILWQPFMILNAVQWLTVFLIYLLCLFFISIYVLIGLVISSRSGSSSLATLTGLLVWIGLVFVYPNCSMYIVNNTVRVPTADTVKRQIETMEKGLEERVGATFPERLPGPAWYNWYDSGEYGLPGFIGVTQKGNFDYNARCVTLGIPIMLSGQEEIFLYQRNVKDQFITQRKTSALLNRLLPGHLLYLASEKIAGTHYRRRDLRLLEQSKIYREQFLDYIRTKNGFGLLFFTRMNPVDMKDNYKEYTEGTEEANMPPNLASLEIGDMPVFRFPGYSVIPPESMIDLGLLLIINILLFITGGFLFSRAEVRIRD